MLTRRNSPYRVGTGHASPSLTRSRIVLWLMLLLPFTGCKQVPTAQPAAASADTSNVLRHATTVQLYRHAGYSRIRLLRPFHDQPGTALDYLLVPKGKPTPPGYPNAIRITVPIERAAVFSLPYMAMLDTLGWASAVVAVYDTAAVFAPRVRAGIQTGRVRNIGSDYQLDPEALLALQPDLALMGTMQSARWQELAVIRQNNIPLFLASDYLEATPLGRAEWLRVTAAMTGSDSLGDAIFQRVAQQYDSLARLARAATPKPTAVAGLILKDTWWMPGGRSYVAAFLRDAGAAYPYASDTTSGSFALALEAAYPVAREADVWFNPEHRQTGPLLAQDARFGNFKSLKTGRVYGYYKRVRGTANDYWERGFIEPHIVLADLVRILHPALLPNHTLVYYVPVQ